MLTARSDGDVLRQWRGKVDSKGYRHLPLSILGERPQVTDKSKSKPKSKAKVPPLTLEVTIVVDGKVRSSTRVRVD